ncbi:hypothetical protein MJO28_016671 [Puccinia striiformis f. sp. tritici]|uniref:Uncharacterized protein n=1 Tax=Puccinia striiformis f. sp. tritici TaxID=168172 RepID=A0ACC0DNV2_9BASI|nr:hypothetical protein MJO28_016671 [Puccinia striiformis f. sp. tritici]
MDPQASFLRFVSGQKVIRKASGKAPVVINQRKTNGTVKDAAAERNHIKGEQPDKVTVVRQKLNQLICDVFDKWPGTNTTSTLAKRNLVLQVKENDYSVTVYDYTGQPSDMKLPQMNNILLGFAKGLVALRGPPQGDVANTLGVDPAKLECADGTNEAAEDADLPKKSTLASKKTTAVSKKPALGRKKPTPPFKKVKITGKLTAVIALGSKSKSEAPTLSSSEDEGPSECGLGASGADLAPSARTIPTRSKTAPKSKSNTKSNEDQDENDGPDNEDVDNHGGDVHNDDNNDSIFED